jgi:Bacterial PH domain
MIFFTPHRIVAVDIQRSQGKVVNVGYRSLLWSSVIVHGVKMAGRHMDQNTCDLLIYTPMMFDPAAQAGSQPGMSLWDMDCHLRSFATAADSALLVQIQQYMTLRGALRSNRPAAVHGSIKHDEYSTQLQELFAKWKAMPDHAAIAQDCQSALASVMPMLLDDEIVVHCHLVGRGDLAVFTNHRIVEVDTQGWSDQRIVFSSIHYANIRGFCFTTDTAEPELQIYTGNLWSLQKFRISYCADDSIMAIAKFLASMIFLKKDSSASDIASIVETLRVEIQKPPAKTGDSLSNLTRSLNVKGLLTSVTDNSLEIKDISEMNSTLRSDVPLLLDNEQIERLFQCGRDFFIYTNYRLLYWDVQGIGVTMFTSWPWMYCAGYSVVTCNAALDRDAELYLYFSIPGRQRKKQSILVSSCDIYNMQQYTSQKVLC